MDKQKQLIRRMVEKAYKHKNGHLASALSALPIINTVYSEFNFGQDVFILSKGHGCLALYAVLENYEFNPDWSKIHPDRDEKNGIYCTTGSLGHGLPIAVGVALAKKLRGEEGKVYVLLGDGECLEGTTWESLNIAAHFDLKNLWVLIDNNQYQAIGKTLIPDTIKIIRMHWNEVIVFNGIKGQGIKLFEKHPDWHVHQLTEEEYKQTMKELK